MLKHILTTILTTMLTTSLLASLAQAHVLKVQKGPSSSRQSVHATVEVVGQELVTRFAVTIPDYKNKMNAKKNLIPGQQFPYMYDVVELFITASPTHYPYLEYELTPLNQNYQVRIKGPRVRDNGVDLGLIHPQPVLSRNGFSAEMRIPLSRLVEELGWNGDPCALHGNLYAISGTSPRSFWSAFPLTMPLNFHQPQAFKPLIETCAQEERR